MVAASESNADMLHATGFRAPDPFAWLAWKNRSALLLSDLEIDRARTEAGQHEVAAYSEWEAKARSNRRKRPAYARVLACYLDSVGVSKVSVPSDFPLGIARQLKKRGISVRPVEGSFLPSREHKSSGEIAALRAAASTAESGMQRAHDILKAATIRKDGKLKWAGRPLTAEILRMEIQLAIVREGGEAKGDAIVACGEQACDPHARGSGPLLAHSLLILDLFPRHSRSGYFGDITRTVVRGQATEAQRTLWHLCLKAQTHALAAIKPGADGSSIQEAAKEFFRKAGYPDEIHEGRWRGFFHGLGHGLGLEIHEEPRLGGTVLKSGHVVTVEPGLYWPGVGGVRHEDVVAVTSRGKSLLTKFPKILEL